MRFPANFLGRLFVKKEWRGQHVRHVQVLFVDDQEKNIRDAAELCLTFKTRPFPVSIALLHKQNERGKKR